MRSCCRFLGALVVPAVVAACLRLWRVETCRLRSCCCLLGACPENVCSLVDRAGKFTGSDSLSVITGACEDMYRLNEYSRAGTSIPGASFQGSKKGTKWLADALCSETEAVISIAEVGMVPTAMMDALLLNILSSRKFMPWTVGLRRVFEDVMDKLDDAHSSQLNLESSTDAPVADENDEWRWSTGDF